MVTQERPVIRWSKPSQPPSPVAPLPVAPLDAPMTAEETAWWDGEYLSVVGKRFAISFVIYSAFTTGANVVREVLQHGHVSLKTIAVGIFSGLVWTSINLALTSDKDRERRLRERRLRAAISAVEHEAIPASLEKRP